MRTRLLSVALAATAAVSLGTTSAGADPLQFERRCTGTYDTLCHDQFCGIVSCQTRDCVVYYDPYQGWNTSTCIGVARPEPGPGGS